jgi:hypothetical protein
MLHKPILSGRVGKWAYALVEYDLHCEPLSSMKGQIVVDFIVGHRVDKQLDLNVGYVTFTPWNLHFDGSICKDGCGVGVVIILPSGVVLMLLTHWIMIVLTTKPNMKLFYLGWRFCMTWE